MSSTLSPDQIISSMRKRNNCRKLANIIICSLIVFLGVTATIYKVRYEGGFLTCFREMTVCATVLTSLTSAALIILNLFEMKLGSEVTFTTLYYWRLSSAVTGFIVLGIVLLGYLPFFTDHPVIGRYDMINMHVIIPLLTIGSFVFNDSAIGKVRPLMRANGLLIIVVYTVFILSLILTNVIPENKIPYSFLNVRHQPFWFIALAFVVVYGGGYLLSWLFYNLNRRLSWCWYWRITENRKNGRK